MMGLIFGLQHFCIHDGPGIRTTVFLKGCPLSCLWCHNPEGISMGRQLSFEARKCSGCGACVRICPEAHSFENGIHGVHQDCCPEKLLDESAGVCLPQALTVVGERISAEALLDRLLRDRRYYEASGGGVTFSGGEPTLQRDFLFAALRLCAEAGLSTALETCGHCDYAVLETLLPYVGLFLFDFKESDPEKHRAFTGLDNQRILENLNRLHAAGADIVLRCPIVPGLNDREEHFRAIGELMARYPGLLGAELLPYHRLAAAKAERLGIQAQASYEQPGPEAPKTWKNLVRAHGGRLIESYSMKEDIS